VPDAWTDALEEAGHQFLLWVYLKGRAHVLEAAPEAFTPETFADFEVSLDERPFEEAVQALRAQLPIDSETFERLSAALRFRAFTVARLAEQDLVARLQEVFTASVEEGEALGVFIDRVGADEILDRAQFGPRAPQYFETVYRTNSTTAYNAGRRVQIEESSGVEQLVYVGIDDQRQTAICDRYDGLRRPADDAIWGTITPPNHFNCRSTVRPVYRGMAEAEEELTPTGEAARRIQNEPPQEGFEASPSTPGEMATLPEGMEERAAEYGILGELRDRQTELGF